MPLSIYPEFVAALEPLLPAFGDPVTFPAGDVLSRRANVNRRWALAMETWPVIDDVKHSIHTARSSIDGAEIAIHRCVKTGRPPCKSAVVYTHGGGYFCLNVPLYHKVLQTLCVAIRCAILRHEYRFAPEHPFPTPVEDSYFGLLWVNQHASDFGLDPTRIAIMGDSAGGGVAAGVANGSGSRIVPTTGETAHHRWHAR